MDDVLVIGRFGQICATMLLFGSAAFEAFVVPAGWRAPLLPLGRPFRLTLTLLVAVTALLWFGAEAAMVGDGWSTALDPATLIRLAIRTDFGVAWIVHLALIVLLLVALALPEGARRRPVLILSALSLASIGLVGHAAMQAGALGLLHRGNDMLHLVAAGFWLGALPPLLAVLWRLPIPADHAEATLALQRFSGLGHIAVAVVLLTGIVNTWLTLGHPPFDFASPYQAMLAAKIGLVTLMLALAIVNRYVVTPRLSNRPPWALIAGAAAEIGLGVVVVALVSAFGTLDPA